jgi:hypothetical protein
MGERSFKFKTLGRFGTDYGVCNFGTMRYAVISRLASGSNQGWMKIKTTVIKSDVLVNSGTYSKNSNFEGVGRE